MVWWRAIIQSIVALAGTALIVTLLDVWLRREELGLRILGVAIIVAVAITTYIRILRPAWRFRVTRSEIAEWVSSSDGERRKLVEAVQLAEVFQQVGTPADRETAATPGLPHGSPGFLLAALQQWFERNEAPKWKSHLNSRALWRPTVLLAAILLSAFIAFLVAPSVFRHAAARLANPLAANPWPLADELRLRNPPAVVALGEAVQLEITDIHPPLPERVDLMVRLVDDDASTQKTSQRIPAAMIGDQAIANLRPLTQAVEVRPVGGEDTGGRWHRIDVIRPPELEDYHFEILPPKYTQMPPERVTGRRIGVLAGSKVRFSGTFAAQLSGLGARFQFASTAVESSKIPIDWQTQWESILASDGQQFTVGTKSGQAADIFASMRWQFVLATRDGLTVQLPEVWSVDAMPDKPPTVSAQPSRLSVVTADGQVRITGRATDDFGIAQLDLLVVTEDGKEYRRSIAKYASPASQKSASFTHTLAIKDLFGGEKSTESPPMQVFIEGFDALGQTTRVSVQKLSIREPDIVLAELTNEQAEIAQQLSDVVRLQADNLHRLDRAATQIDSSDDFQQSDADELESVARTQSDVLRQLNDPSTGLKQRISEALDSLVRNRLDQQHRAAESLETQLSNMRDRISELSQRDALAAADSASRMSATAARNVADARGVQRQLQRQIELAQQSSEELLSGLQRLQDRVATSQARRQLANDLVEVLNQQKTLRRETDQVQLDSLDRTAINAYQQGLRQLTLDQTLLADNLKALVDRADRLASRTSDSQETDASQQQEALELGRAAEEIRQAGVTATMRKVSDRLRGENFADAATGQASAIESLEQALGTSQSGTTTIASELEQLANQARSQTRKLRQLADQQQQLSDDLAQPNTNHDVLQKLASRQEQLRKQTEQLRQQAVSSGRGELADQLETIAKEQSKASENAIRDSQVASDSASRAAEGLGASADWLENRADALAEQLRRQQSLSLEEQLAALVVTQSDILLQIRKSVDLDNVAENSITITQLLLSQQQSTARTRRSIDQLPTFAWALEQVDRSLERARAAAQRQRLVPQAERAAETALRWLEQAAIAIQSVEDELSPNPSGDALTGEENEASPNSTTVQQPPLASIKLLRALQADIRNETLRLQAAPASLERSRGLSDLATQQEALGQELGKLLESLSR